MSYLSTFERNEMKFLLSPDMAKKMRERLLPFIKPDMYPDETLNSLYFDTPDFLLIRRSIEKPVYKEKIRLRSYGTINCGDKVYVEIKKKFKDTVYKRRVAEDENTAMQWLCNKTNLTGTQIEREISYSAHMYNNLQPRVFIAYDRLSYIAVNDSNLRITFDRNPRYRTTELMLSNGSGGSPLLPPGYELLEIKSHLCLPMWLTAILSDEKIYKTTFSKYGETYARIIKNEKGMMKNVSNF